MNPVNFTMRFEGLTAIADAFARAPEIAQDELTPMVYQAELLAQREIQELTPVGATSILRGSILAQQPEVLADRVLGAVGTSAAHAIPVEIGTKPHFPPLAPLEDWVEAKLGVSGEDVPRIAYAIARKISQRGTPGAHMFERAFEKTRPQIEGMFTVAAERIRDRLEASGA